MTDYEDGDEGPCGDCLEYEDCSESGSYKPKQCPQAEQATASSLSDLLADPSIIYDCAITKWGFPSQIEMLVEECAELIVAVKHFNRERHEDVLPLINEIADVEIMLEQMRRIFDCELIDMVKRKKLTRLAERTGQHVVLYG